MVQEKGFDSPGIGIAQQCVTCGFFGKHAIADQRPLPTPTFYEIEFHERQAGQAFSHMPDLSFGKAVKTEPICYRQVVGFSDLINAEIEKGGVWEVGPHQSQAVLLGLILEENDCDEWFEYVWGLNPMQHLGGLASQEAEKRQREWERLLSEDTKKFQTQLAEDTKRFQAEIAKDGGKTQRKMLDVSLSQRRWTIGAVFAGVVVTTVLTTLTILLTEPDSLDSPLPVIIVSTAAVPVQTAPVAVALTPTPSPESAPGTALSPPQSAP